MDHWGPKNGRMVDDIWDNVLRCGHGFLIIAYEHAHTHTRTHTQLKVCFGQRCMYLTHFYPLTKILRYGNPSLISKSSLFLYDVTCQYAAVYVETTKVIAAEVIVCFLGMLCKWKRAVLAWLSVLQLQYEVYG